MIYYSSWIYGWAVDSIIDLDYAWLGSSGWSAVDSYVSKSAGIGWSRMALAKATDCSMYLILHKYGLDSSSSSCKSPREEVDTYKCFFQVLLASGLLLTHCLKPILCLSPGSVRDSLPTLSSCMDTRRHEKYGRNQYSMGGKFYVSKRNAWVKEGLFRGTNCGVNIVQSTFRKRLS